MSYTNGLDKPSDYFETLTWSGNSTDDRAISGLDFAPNWVWIKCRNNGQNHNIFDTVRGATESLESNNNNAENTDSTSLKSFTSDGYTLGTGSTVNSSSPSTKTYVAWNWKAGTSFSNSSGSNGANLDSTGSVSTTAGFSIVSFTGNRSTTRNIYHGLGAVPKMIIFKNRDTTNGWTVYNEAIGNANKLTLNGTNASSGCSACFGSTTPTSTLFTVGDDSDTNGTSNNMIAYCFAEKKGFSKAFSYIGNGSTNGSYIHLGFKPSFVLLKRTDSANSWPMWDNKRNPHNVGFNTVYANESSAEFSATYGDFLSTGLKLRSTSGAVNASGGTYIGFAIAENPFVSSSGIPTTAR